MTKVRFERTVDDLGPVSLVFKGPERLGTVRNIPGPRDSLLPWESPWWYESMVDKDPSFRLEADTRVGLQRKIKEYYK